MSSRCPRVRTSLSWSNPGPADQRVVLTATVQKIVTEILASPDPDSFVAFGKDARDLLIDCCVEFITLISSEANEISEKEAKKTIAPEHIDKALRELGFPEYVREVLASAGDMKESLKVSKQHHQTLHYRSREGLLNVRIMLTNATPDAREENKQDGSERSQPGRAVAATARAVCLGQQQIQPGLKRLPNGSWSDEAL